MCFASLDDAKDMVDKYYQYSMEKDVESYVALFDPEYLTHLYGEDSKEFFQEVFTYFDIQDYDLDYQYYTESDESLSLFFNLKSETLIDGQKTEIDNDQVAFFTKDPLKLRYIILQEEFIGQMNREFIYEAAITAIVEKNSDLKAEAEEKGVSLTDYNFEEKIAAHNAKHSTGWIWIILIALLLVTATTLDLSKHIKNKKYRKKYVHIRKEMINLALNIYAFIVKMTRKASKFIVALINKKKV
ncbi:MAG: hypothetical protein R6V53_03720 [Candidatus Woesearchaeota archaeon]